MVLEIPKADGRIVSYNDICYIRIGSSKEKLSKYPEKEQVLFEKLFYKKLNISNIESNYQDLTFNKFLIYCSTKNIFVNMNTYKESFNFLTEDGKYNYLAQLMSDNSHVNIRFAIFSGTDKTTKL